MNIFKESYLTIINESKNYSDKIKVLEDGLLKIDNYIANAKKNDRYLAQFLDMQKQYKEQLILYTRPVTVVLYGQTKEFQSAVAALDYFYEALKYCDPEGAEAYRYDYIISELQTGNSYIDSDSDSF